MQLSGLLIAFVTLLVGSTLALLAIEPNSIGPRAATYASWVAPYAWVGWLILIGVGVYLAGVYGKRLGRFVRTKVDDYLLDLMRREFSPLQTPQQSSDIDKIVEAIARTPAHLDTLAGHMGIGKATTGDDSVRVRLGFVEQYKSMLHGLPDIIHELRSQDAKLEQIINDAHAWTRNQFAMRDKLRDLISEWPNLRDSAVLLAELPGQPDSALDWDSWFMHRDSWKIGFEIWSQRFPEQFKKFQSVRKVLDISAEQVGYAHTRYSRDKRFGTHAQENAYFTYLAIYDQFKEHAGTALHDFEHLASM